MKTIIKILFWLANKCAGHNEEGLITKNAVYFWKKKQAQYARPKQRWLFSCSCQSTNFKFDYPNPPRCSICNIEGEGYLEIGW